MSNYEKLIAQREELDHQIEAAHQEELIAAIETVRKLIKQFQLAPKDCGFKQRERVSKKKPSCLAKFRGPNGKTWSGRGRAPAWLTVLEKQGTSREQFRINNDIPSP